MFTLLFLYSLSQCFCICFFFFNDTATTEIYTLSLHDALPISFTAAKAARSAGENCTHMGFNFSSPTPDRKSTRLNSSHGYISYAVFCLKKKKNPHGRLYHTLHRPRASARLRRHHIPRSVCPAT